MVGRHRFPSVVNATETLTLIVPTRNERDNIRPLLDRLTAIDLRPLVEVVFVDDSDDDTPQIIRDCELDYDVPIELIHRRLHDRAGGLGGAVIEGLRASKGTLACVMDADLQHPPERVEALYEAARVWPADLVVGTRYREQGNATGLSAMRLAVSRLAGLSVRSAFPRRLRGISDPMSGFFLVRLSALDLNRLEGRGFKILLEIAATHPDLRRAEVPYEFGNRHAGETKASVAEGRRLLDNVRALRSQRVRHRYLYDIHGIICVEADSRLPELKAFRVPGLNRPADVTVTTGVGRTGRTHNGETSVAQSIEFQEVFGRLGFAVRIDRAPQRTRVAVSRLVSMSPHVLYTNVVEPILRWMFAERGYALVHAACLELDGEAFFITARTDTGKTTTMLKVLDESEYRFVADDLTLIASDGTVLPYPKPLTISAHTLQAVKRNRLTWKQRIFLPIQSRLHSKQGRRVGFMLAESKVPAATANAIAQRLIPPPKYHVEQLIPDTSVASAASVASLFIIERGGTGELELEHGLAMETLLENCEDAYGFPPYQVLEPFLRNAHVLDLADVEKQIIADAFDAAPAMLLRSDTLDWAERIPGKILAIRLSEVPRVERAVSGAAAG